MFDSEQIEVLARSIHEQYLETWSNASVALGEPPTESDMAGLTWDELSEEQKKGSRAQATRIPEKLAALYLLMVPLTWPGAHRLVLSGQPVSEGESVIVLPEDRILGLARQEHNEWVLEKRRSGWTPGPFNRANKVHNLLVDFDVLTPAQQLLDVDPVRNLPALLRLVGMGVVAV